MLPDQLFANKSEKAAIVLGSLPSMGKVPGLSSWLLPLFRPGAGHCSHMKELISGFKISLPLFLSFSLCHSALQINIINLFWGPGMIA